MFGERLRLARKRAGLSLRELAGQLDNQVSAQAIGKYESGQMFPSSGVLVALGKALNVDLDFLTSAQVADLCGVEFRKDVDTSVKDASRIEAAVIDRVERYLAIEAVLDLPSEAHDLSGREPKVVSSYEEAEAIGNELRKDWNLGDDPIPGVTRLLEEKGIKVLALDMPPKFSGLTCEVQRTGTQPPLPVIVVGTGFSIERHRFTLCHELAHRLISGAKDGLEHERVMHRFASAFLMPAERIRKEFGASRHALAYEEIKRVKHFYGVSAAALIVRLRDLEIIREGYVSYLFQTQARTWRTVEPDPLDPKGEMAQAETPERFERLVYRALAEQLIALPKASTLLQKPVHDVEIAIRGPAVADAYHRQ
jgi:Zn-dependent peptidase ImmA (M78 family)/DNA-binding XRE family transcriptional regulator